MTPEPVWQVALFTAVAAAGATALALGPALAIAWALARGRFVGKAIVETVVTLPLVLPPVATGLLLLWAIGPNGPAGRLAQAVGVDIVFTWKAVVLAMAVMGLPLLVRTARTGFEQGTRRYEQMAETLGAGRWRVFTTITLPLAARPILAGTLLAFARALGEFGATIVIAGSIPGRTRTLASGMYAAIETGQESAATALLAVSIALAIGAVVLSNRLTSGRA